MSRGFKELVTICWDTFSDNIAMLTGPIQQLLLCCHRTPCPTIFYTGTDQCPIQMTNFSFFVAAFTQLAIPLWIRLPTYEPVLGCKLAEQSPWTWSLAQGWPLQSRVFRHFGSSNWNSLVFWYLREISLSFLFWERNDMWQNIFSRLTYYRNNEVVRFSSFFIFINFLQFKNV